MRKIIRYFGVLLVAAATFLMTAWGSLAIYYSNLSGENLRIALAAAFAVLTCAAFILLKNRRWTLVGFLVLFLCIVAWWATLKPSNARVWQPDVGRLPYATVQRNLVTIHNIRNLAYRTETDFHGTITTRPLTSAPSILLTSSWSTGWVTPSPT